jgi:hypothetical protein
MADGARAKRTVVPVTTTLYGMEFSVHSACIRLTGLGGGVGPWANAARQEKARITFFTRVHPPPPYTTGPCVWRGDAVRALTLGLAGHTPRVECIGA